MKHRRTKGSRSIYTSRGVLKTREVESFKKIKDINAIKKYFLDKGNYRDYLWFTMGINVGLRIEDLRHLYVGDVIDRNSQPREILRLYESKTGHYREITLNRSVAEAIELCKPELKIYDSNRDRFLFTHSYTKREPLSGTRYYQILNKAVKDLNIQGNYGTHSMRKTFGYHLYNNGVPIETICKIFGHSSPAQTLRYIGITKEDIKEHYRDLCL